MKACFFLGTAAELIKIYPVIREIESRGGEWTVLSSGQSEHNFWQQYDDFRLPRDRTVRLLEASADLSHSGQALRWFLRAALVTRTQLLGVLEERQSSPFDFWVVHGDTLSALIGAWHGSSLKIPVLHIEAGLRSPSLLRPFPEEISRRLVSRMASLHAAPDTWAQQNLEQSGVRGGIKVTGGNTLLDAVRWASTHYAQASQSIDGSRAIPKDKVFALVNIHRFENLQSRRRWSQIADSLLQAAKSYPLVIVLHPQTKRHLESHPDLKEKLEQLGAKFLDRLSFTQFIRLVHESHFVISDGGSNQEECYYLGKPCLLLRDATERREGLGENALLSHFSEKEISSFIENPSRWARPPLDPTISPSKEIVAWLESISKQR